MPQQQQASPLDPHNQPQQQVTSLSPNLQHPNSPPQPFFNIVGSNNPNITTANNNTNNPSSSPNQQPQQLINGTTTSVNEASLGDASTGSSVNNTTNSDNEQSLANSVLDNEDSGVIANCIRSGCTNPAVYSAEWENEYCSNECVVSHCRLVMR